MATWERNPDVVTLQVNKDFAPITLFFDEAKLRISFIHYKIHRDLGERSKVKTGFLVRMEEPLYVGLQFLKYEDPAALKNLIANLVDYLISNQLEDSKQKLLEHAITELNLMLGKGAGR